ERLWRTVKYCNIYIMCYETYYECEAGLTEFFRQYNDEIPHQSLNYFTSSAVYDKDPYYRMVS
ncbi:MAG: integrase core domain-containing protein, partial [Spirochaetia bacterium]|nr:integrase core domain-containing protein [Spirochaetia bacterium]